MAQSPNWQEKYHLYTTYSPCLRLGVICYRSHLLGEPETIIENGWEVQLLQNWDKSAYTLDLARPHPRHRCE